MKYLTFTDIGERSYNADALAVNPKQGIFVIADGVGNTPTAKAASAKASQYACSAVAENNKQPVSRILSAMKNANAIREEIPGGATTLDVLLIKDEKAYLGHIGDAQVVLAREGKTIPLTKEHNDFLGILQKYIGDSIIEPDIITYGLKQGDLIAMMTDGIHRVISTRELNEILAGKDDLEEMLDKIKIKIYENINSEIKLCPQDNYSIILLRY